MGFLNPLALLALPLAALPLVFDRMGRRRTAPLGFSSLYLLERARRSPARRSPARAPWTALLRALAIAALVVAAARPVGPGGGAPDHHRPTRAVVAVDVSRSTAQTWEGSTAWGWIAAAADSVLAAAGPDDEIALAAVADGAIGWWEGRPERLRRRLSRLGPTGRASDWPAIVAALAARSGEDAETYLFTDGARGAYPPASPPETPLEGHRALRVWPAPPAPNRAATEARWVAEGSVLLEARGWGSPIPSTVVAGRRRGSRLVERRAIPLSAREEADPSAPWTWTVGDTATFAIAEGDRFPVDDQLPVARGTGGPYRIARWVPRDRPPEPGSVFWEAALGSASRTATIERVESMAALVESAPDLALLPVRPYRPGEAAALASLTEGGTRLLFVPRCPDPACVHGPGWMPAAGPQVPALRWRLLPPGRTTTLAPRPDLPLEGRTTAGIPDHVAARVPIRGRLETIRGPASAWTWDLADGTPALWVRGPVAVWLVPFGPPVTRLGTTPLFPLVADAALARWDPAWRRDGTIRVADPVPLPADEAATVIGPIGAASPRRWRVEPGELAPRPERPGLYRIDAGTTAFVAVRSDPAEGDLRRIEPEAWRRAWGALPIGREAWPDVVFPRRRGPEWTRWSWIVAVAALAIAAFARRGRPGGGPTPNRRRASRAGDRGEPGRG